MEINKKDELKMIIIKETVRDEQIALVRRGNHLKIRSINSFNIVEATRKKNSVSYQFIGPNYTIKKIYCYK